MKFHWLAIGSLGVSLTLGATPWGGTEAIAQTNSNFN